MTEKPTPEFKCGDKFCEDCGDCLYCYGGEPCYGDGKGEHGHAWPASEDMAAEKEWGQA